MSLSINSNSVTNNNNSNNNSLEIDKKDQLPQMEINLSPLFSENVIFNIQVNAIDPLTGKTFKELAGQNSIGLALVKIKKEHEVATYQAFDAKALQEALNKNTLEKLPNPIEIKKTLGFIADPNKGFVYLGSGKNLSDIANIFSQASPKASETFSKKEVKSSSIIDLSFLYPKSQFQILFDEEEREIFSYSTFKELIKEKESNPYLLAFVKTALPGKHVYHSFDAQSLAEGYTDKNLLNHLPIKKILYVVLQSGTFSYLGSNKALDQSIITKIAKVFDNSNSLQDLVDISLHYFHLAQKEKNPQLKLIYEKQFFAYAQKAAEQGLASGQNNLGYCYQHGIGTNKDAEKAFACYQKAAEQGLDSARNNLGHCYEHGIGTTKDILKAIEYYTKAAQQNCKRAFYHLGQLYYQGIEIEKNEKLGIEYLEQAAKLQDEDAIKMLQKIKL